MPCAGSFESLSLGGRNKTGKPAIFTDLSTVVVSGTMEPGHWGTTDDQVTARKLLILRRVWSASALTHRGAATEARSKG
jgi:hypothetical protein